MALIFLLILFNSLSWAIILLNWLFCFGISNETLRAQRLPPSRAKFSSVHFSPQDVSGFRGLVEVSALQAFLGARLPETLGSKHSKDLGQEAVY